MPSLRVLKAFQQTHKIKIGKSLKRVDSDCIFWCSRLYHQQQRAAAYAALLPSLITIGSKLIRNGMDALY